MPYNSSHILSPPQTYGGNVQTQTGKLFPDLLLAFGVDPAIAIARNSYGYGIDYMGQPPETSHRPP